MQHGAYKPHKTVVFYGSDSRQQLGKSLDDSRDFLLSGHGSCRHLIYFPYFILFLIPRVLQCNPCRPNVWPAVRAEVSGRNIK